MSRVSVRPEPSCHQSTLPWSHDKHNGQLRPLGAGADSTQDSSGEEQWVDFGPAKWCPCDHLLAELAVVREPPRSSVRPGKLNDVWGKAPPQLGQSTTTKKVALDPSDWVRDVPQAGTGASGGSHPRPPVPAAETSKPHCPLGVL